MLSSQSPRSTQGITAQLRKSTINDENEVSFGASAALFENLLHKFNIFMLVVRIYCHWVRSVVPVVCMFYCLLNYLLVNFEKKGRMHSAVLLPGCRLYRQKVEKMKGGNEISKMKHQVLKCPSRSDNSSLITYERKMEFSSQQLSC